MKSMRVAPRGRGRGHKKKLGDEATNQVGGWGAGGSWPVTATRGSLEPGVPVFPLASLFPRSLHTPKRPSVTSVMARMVCVWVRTEVCMLAMRSVWAAKSALRRSFCVVVVFVEKTNKTTGENQARVTA